jgi:anti-sigma regulatory factor (Ser/Thr protein kinase)
MTENRAETKTGPGRAKEVVSLVVPSNPKYLYVIRSAIYPLVMEAGFTKRDAQRIVLAVDEACSNVIKYAYEGDYSKSYSLDVTIGKGKLVVELKDSGKKPDVTKIVPRKLDDVRPGGLGTHFIASVFDSVQYDTTHEDCTVLTLVKEKQ